MAVVVSGNAVPFGTDNTLNKEIAEIWKDMEERMDQLAKMSPGEDYDKNLKSENVLEKLNAVQSGHKKKSEKWARLKNTFNHTLTVISNVGGMIADATSQVFAPAGQCYNALNFVINAYKGYQSIYDALNELFESCVGFIGRLNQYVHAKMSPQLTKLSCDVLRHFVSVCDKALRFRRSPLFKLKTMGKVAFLSQNEFLDLLDEMEKLTRKESLQVAADTLVYASQAADNSQVNRNILEESKAERLEEKKKKKDRRVLLNTLQFDRSAETWDGIEQAPIATWGSTYQRIRQHHVKDTGKWVLENPSYKAWAKKDGDKPILGIVGPAASGKTYLASAIISHLQKEGSGEGINHRHLVAFYYLDKKMANGRISALGKSIIWQFAQSDASYMQSAAWTCENTGHIESKYFLTRLLLDNHKELMKIDATFYIVINKLGDKNGYIHEGVLDFLQKASHSKKGSVRILFTATQETINQLEKNGVSCPTISMKNNREDLQRYIDARMNRIDVLSDTENDQVNEIREKVQYSLQTQTNGNFYLINNLLDEISLLDLETDIYGVLEGAGRSLSQHIDDDIRKLNATRTTKELEEINEVILWVTFARERMTVEKMEAVLQFKNNAASLRPLEERLKKFLLFEIDEGLVSFRSEKILDKIPERARAAEDRQKNGEVVNQGEVDMLWHFLGNVCPPGLVKKLELKQHFEQKLNPRQEQIYQEDENTAHFKLAKICLHALTSPAGDNLRVLRGYAARQMVYHMAQVELSPIDRDLKRQMGPHLVRLFREEPAIDNLFWANKAIPQLPPWMRDNPMVEVICKWLKDTSIKARVPEDTKSWLEELLNDKPHTVKTLNEPSMIRMAHWCLQKKSPAGVALATFDMVSQFLSFFGLLSTPNDEQKGKAPYQNRQVEKWCQDMLQVKERDSLWHCQMGLVLARLPGELREESEARARCHEALRLEKDNWRASFLLATLIDSHEKAREILKKLINRFKNDSNWKEENEESLAQMAYLLGCRYWTEKKFEKAIDWFLTSNKYGLRESSFVLDILLKYQSTEERWDEITVFIEQMHSRSLLTPTVIELATKHEFHAVIFRAVTKTKKFKIFDQVYPNAIKFATKTTDHRVLFELRQSYASALSACPFTKSIRSDACWKAQQGMFHIPTQI